MVRVRGIVRLYVSVGGMLRSRSEVFGKGIESKVNDVTSSPQNAESGQCYLSRNGDHVPEPQGSYGQKNLWWCLYIHDSSDSPRHSKAHLSKIITFVKPESPFASSNPL